MAKAADTRAKLIAGAMDVLSRDGVAGTTTRKIADASGQRLATMHYHFKDKDALLFAVLDEVALILNRYLEAELKPAPNLSQRVETLIRAVWQLMARTRDLQILQFEMTFYAVRSLDAAGLAEKQYKGLLELYERFLNDPAASPADAAKIKRLTHFVVAGLDGILVQELAYPDSKRSEESIGYLIGAAKSLAVEIG